MRRVMLLLAMVIVFGTTGCPKIEIGPSPDQPILEGDLKKWCVCRKCGEDDDCKSDKCENAQTDIEIDHDEDCVDECEKTIGTNSCSWEVTLKDGNLQRTLAATLPSFRLVSYKSLTFGQFRNELAQLPADEGDSSTFQGKAIDCRAECLNVGGESSGLCLAVSPGPDGNYDDRISRFVSTVRKYFGETIPKSRLMHDFDQELDVCERSDTDLRNGLVRNSGRACVLAGHYGLAKPRGIDVTILMPASIEGEVARSNGLISAEFLHRSKAIALRFPDDTLLNSEYGGRVRKIEFYNGWFLIATEVGCIGTRTVVPP